MCALGFWTDSNTTPKQHDRVHIPCLQAVGPIRLHVVKYVWRVLDPPNGVFDLLGVVDHDPDGISISRSDDPGSDDLTI